jgi:hypothetical protein
MVSRKHVFGEFRTKYGEILPFSREIAKRNMANFKQISGLGQSSWRGQRRTVLPPRPPGLRRPPFPSLPLSRRHRTQAANRRRQRRGAFRGAVCERRRPSPHAEEGGCNLERSAMGSATSETVTSKPTRTTTATPFSTSATLKPKIGLLT